MLELHRCRRTLHTASIVAAVAALLVVALCQGVSADERAVGELSFNRDIQPILSANCFLCHGRDEHRRGGGLRLDQRESAVAELDSGARAIVPGDPAASELVARITEGDPAMRMPPPEANKELSTEQIERLRQWIATGAEYEPHWSFVAPVRPPLPQVENERWVRGAIDRFVLARLDAEGLEPSPPASRRKLIRRLTLDLTGLPPTPAEVESFVSDNRPDAYERLVDRLLASPQFGERMALAWLDAARYADTHGYHIDSHRDMWLWRDWVIKALNDNMPFDEFTTWQLAGDMLPDATVEQQIASGFHRNHPINFEGGAIPEEYHTEYVIDRVSTTGTVWMGLTLGCARCHDHKYDPVSQTEFFQLYAFFNTVDEQGLDGQRGNARPKLSVPTPAQQQRQAELTQQIADVEAQLADLGQQLDDRQRKWEESLGSGGPALSDARSAIEMSDWYVMGPFADETARAVFETEYPPELGPVDLETTVEFAGTSHAWTARPRIVDGQLHDAAKLGHPERTAAYFYRRLQTNSPTEIRLSVGSTDGLKVWLGGVLLLASGEESPVATHRHQLSLPLAAGENHLLMKVAHYSWECEHFFALRGDGRLNVPTQIRKLAEIAPAERNEKQTATLRDYFRRNVLADEEYHQLDHELAELRRAAATLAAEIPTTMVMREMPEPRETFRLEQGQYHSPAEKVTAATPAALPPLPAGAEPNRLGLARWLLDPAHPLTGRVTVNRFWQLFFGQGLVKTSDDFGMQGERPTHPDLLDWLAVEFRESGWDVKQIVRQIVTSATYRQDSAVSPELVRRDPENRLLARGPRFRLQAEFVRDLALSVSGLLDDRIGGPSVKPYQPPDLWRELAHQKDNAKFSAQIFEQDHGQDLYRRSMYTFWKRSVPPPNLAALDAPNREICVVRRERTNTPLQALVLLNDPTFVESARALAERLLDEGDASVEERATRLFTICTSRPPTPAELSILTSEYERQRQEFEQDRPAAEELLAVGESPRDTALDAAEHAAWASVALMVQNLDETITKE